MIKQAVQLSKALILSSFLLLANQSYAEQQNAEVNIAKPDDARVFAKFTDKLPAVMNYFTKASEKAVIEFYKDVYGEILTTNRKRGRLTITFNSDNQDIRVVISQQNHLRQVDVLIEKQKNITF